MLHDKQGICKAHQSRAGSPLWSILFSKSIARWISPKLRSSYSWSDWRIKSHLVSNKKAQHQGFTRSVRWIPMLCWYQSCNRKSWTKLHHTIVLWSTHLLRFLLYHKNFTAAQNAVNAIFFAVRWVFTNYLLVERTADIRRSAIVWIIKKVQRLKITAPFHK